MTLAFIVAAVLLMVMVAGSFALLAMGRLHLDLGWGRSVHPLGPIRMQIEAPREVVYEVLSAPYTGKASSETIDVLTEGEDVVVAAHHTQVHFYTAKTVEAIDLQPPERMGFRHLTGPVPHAVEQFVLSEDGASTELCYDGQIGIDYFALGRIAAKRWVRPQWEDKVREHLEDVKARAEAKARSRERRQKS